MSAFVHPLTGELMDASPENLERADRETRDELGRLYRALRPVTEALADTHGQTVVPGRRNRTAVQERAVRCPHCSRFYTESAA